MHIRREIDSEAILDEVETSLFRTRITPGRNILRDVAQDLVSLGQFGLFDHGIDIAAEIFCEAFRDIRPTFINMVALETVFGERERVLAREVRWEEGGTDALLYHVTNPSPVVIAWI
jgi:hypothetical protein